MSEPIHTHVTFGVPADIYERLTDKFKAGAFPNWKLGNLISVEEAVLAERVAGLMICDLECSEAEVAQLKEILRGKDLPEPTNYQPFPENF